MVKLIIFDFDGVIITGSNEGYFACYHKALESVGVKLSAEEERKRVLAWWGKGYKQQLQLLLKEHPGLLTPAIKVWDECYESPMFTQNIRLVKGAREALKNLADKYTLAIASGMRRKTMDRLIKEFDIDYFKKIVTNEDVKNIEDMKPAPFMLNKILNELSFPPEEAIFVGDAENDVIMAKRAGVEPVVVLTGHLTDNEARRVAVDAVLSDITHLYDFITKNNNF